MVVAKACHQFERAHALYNFTGQASNQLSFTEGDEIKLVPGGKVGGWLTGELRGKTGIIPGNYVRVHALCDADDKAAAP